MSETRKRNPTRRAASGYRRYAHRETIGATSSSVGDNEAMEKLFEPRERWGWEYVESSPIQSSPKAFPEWHEPSPLDTRTLELERDRARSGVKKGGIGLVVLVLLGLAAGGSVAVLALLAAAVIGVVTFWPVISASSEIERAQQEWEENRTRLAQEHDATIEQWQRRARARAKREESLDNAPLWYPLQPQARPSRVDVFGGTGDGWASLVATVGSGVLAAGQSVLVLDFSEQDVAGGLAALVALRGLPVRQHELPADLHALDLFHDLGAEDLGELLAEAAYTGRQSADSADLRAVGADLIHAVAQRLDEPITFRRLVAGLQVLQRVYDSRDDDLLSPQEERRLAAYVDAVPQTERVQNELGYLRSVFELLAREERQAQPATEPRTDLRAQAALTVLATNSGNARRKTFTDSVVFQSVLHHLRGQTGQVRPDLLLVAGADRIGKEGLESLARHARRCRVRLVYLLEGLRGDVQQLLGHSDSAALFMRLGNAQEAEAAAKHIGHGHKFVLSQLTSGIGQSFTTGESTGESTLDGVTETRGQNSSTSSGGGGGSRSSGTSWSLAKARSTTWQQTKSWSEAKSTNQGTTEARVYEYTVEPTTIQSLPATAFVLVDSGPGGRRMAFGDCNPGIAALDRVARQPRELVVGQTPPPPSPPTPDGHASPSPQQPRVEQTSVASVVINDPQEMYTEIVESLRELGYDAYYERDDRTPVLSGWKVYRSDGAPMDNNEIQYIMDHFPADGG